MAALRPVRERLHGQLVEVFHGRSPTLADRRLVAAAVLANYAADGPAELADLACDANAEQFTLLRPPLNRNRKEVLAALTAELAREAPAQDTEADRIAWSRRQGNAAATLAALGEPDAAWPVLRHSRTPDARTVLIHALASRGADPCPLIRRLEQEIDASVRAALILALGEYTAERLPPEVRAPLMPKLLAWYRTDPDPGVHGAIDWLLRQSKEGPTDRPLDWGGRKDLERIDAELAGKPGPAGQRWYVNDQGQTFTAVRGPVEFFMGSPERQPDHVADETLHRRTINRSFAVAVRPVTVAQWERFLEAMKTAKLEVGHSYTKRYAPEPDCPIITVTWYEAAMYCRWLSEVDKVPERQMVYPPIEEILQHADGQTPLKLPKDQLSRTGYRLPTEAEFEYACRADTVTRWYCSGAEDFLPRYAWFMINGEDRTWPVGQKKPNELGLFDMHGNVWVWCQGGSRPYDPAGMDDREDARDVQYGITHPVRGGSFYSYARDLRSACCRKYEPTYRRENDGFRLARTLPPDHFAALPPK
jgi:formylglycine-generating enzyme required for sulfatase activity